MDVYSYADYKDLIRARVKELQTLGRPMTLKRVAQRTPVQYTYLSRALNRADTHLTEDQLYSISQILELVSEEVDYLLLLRSLQTAADPRRKDYLRAKVERSRRNRALRARSRDAEGTLLTQEMAYLFDPLCVVSYIALHLPHVRENPKLLCPALGIDVERLKEIFRKLAAMDFIETGMGGIAVERLNKSSLHYGVEHPLVRVHQHLLRTPSLAQIQKTPEDRKLSFDATFTMDRSGFERLKKEFKIFRKKVEDVATSSKDEHLYQINLDAFEWL